MKEKFLLFLKLNENGSKFQPDNENGVECRPKLGGMNQVLGLNPDLLQRIFRKFDGGFQMITEIRSNEIVKKMRDAAIAKAEENCIQVNFFIQLKKKFLVLPTVQGFMASGLHGFMTSGLHGFRASGLHDFRASWLHGFRASGLICFTY